MKRLILFILLCFAALTAYAQTTSMFEETQALTEEPILVIDPQGHSARIWDIMFVPDGKTLISISFDKTVRLWDVETGDLLKTIRGQTGESFAGMLQAGALSPDGKMLAVGGYLGEIESDAETIIEHLRLFNLESGKLIGLLHGHTDIITDLAFSPDGKWLASGSDDDTIHIWDISAINSNDRPIVANDPLATLEGHTSDITAIAFSPDGTKLVSVADKGILWDWQKQKQLETLKKHPEGVSCVAYAPDGQYIVSGGWYGKILLWDGNGKFIKELDELDGVIGTVAFSADSQKIVVALRESPYHAIVYALPSGEQLITFTEHTDFIVTSAFYENAWIATAGGDKGDIYIWDANSGSVKTHITGKGSTVWTIALRQTPGEGISTAFGNTNPRGDESDLPPLEKSFNFSEMSLDRHPPDEADFRRAQTEYKDRRLEYKNENELNIIGGKTIKTDPETDGLIRSYTFTNTGDVIIGTSYVLKLYRNDGTFLREFYGHTGEILAVAVSQDGRILASASDDQTIKVWNLNTGECLATLFVATDNEWICWTPQGYYAASAGGEKYIGWHLNQGLNKTAKFYPVYVFRKRFYHPELVKRTIAVGDFQQALEEVNAESQEKIEETAVIEVLPPKVRWISPQDPTMTTSQPSIRIEAEIQSDSELTSVKILVNGRTQAKERGLIIEEAQKTLDNIIDQEIPLTPGNNEIAIFAANADAGALSEIRTVFYDAEDLKPDLYMVSIGISGYQRSDLQLTYADDDAKAISQVFQGQEGRLYRNVIIKELYDQDATQKSIIKTIEWLKNRATQKDVVVMFIAAHGHNKAGEYYLFPADGNPDDLERTGVSWQVFSESLGNLPSRVLLFLDTCHSGQLGQDLSVLGTRVDNTEAIRQLSSDEYGVVILAASTGREFSLEHPDWGHGAFTKALVEALEQGQADYSSDGIILLRELDLYIAERVDALTKGEQHPTTQKPSTISRFPIVQVK